MKRISKLLGATLVLLTAHLVHAQQDRPHEVPFKKSYERTQTLPDGVAFHQTLRMLRTLNENGYRDDAIQVVGTKLRLEKDEASARLDELLHTLDVMMAEVREAQKQKACLPGSPYALLQELYDVEEEIAGRYHDETRDSFEGTDVDRFLKWMSERKSDITYHRIDFEEADRRRGRSSRDTLNKSATENSHEARTNCDLSAFVPACVN